MRSDVAGYELTAPPTLQAVLTQLAAEPGRHALLAGGTELMVALNTGHLANRSLLSIQHLRELRFIRVEENAVHLGAGTTFTDIRRDQTIARELPLLARAASWTGSIANQNRGTVGGNLCNASPAADTPPALLAYDAAVTLVSVRGERTVPYADFHLGYKRTILGADEVLYSVTVPLAYEEWRQYIRKVGTRNAQAISKTAIAAVARTGGDRIEEIRIGAASLADRPMRCLGAEAALRGRSLAGLDLDETVRAGRAALAREAKPIDDIRSTAMYRSAVAQNLLEEFLRSIAG
ncbi:MAG TPA: FAD binding domain-containing protein [Acidobacteriaceae bacterium]|jgi:CO/xanthine dehydrogenase FAD-binding subunit|nr:FAD binding domain-containing protein [Acidobacteriaceae bacterium]